MLYDNLEIGIGPASDRGYLFEARSDTCGETGGQWIDVDVGELSEALESLRHGDPPDDMIPEYSGAEVELADVLIRIMDYSVARGLRVAEALATKMTYNRGRAHKHGKHF